MKRSVDRSRRAEPSPLLSLHPVTSFHVIVYPRDPNEEGRTPMKKFQCGSLVPGCDWHTRHEEEAEIMRRVVQHMRETHGETIIRETMIEAIRSRIEKVPDAA